MHRPFQKGSDAESGARELVKNIFRGSQQAREREREREKAPSGTQMEHGIGGGGILFFKIL